ncbi:PspC domain-containing protein [Brachybacterium sp. Marseille-Q7125]|uniref:PspC domain-containing protein n=1 Tax=Brachybacterium sp. Marseille-Q7125 TaxID=2932815 RepID=UPI001FF43EE4|nr:PspC domain-containing protein [Brachybacterium sp. Marseille-Q7125]
MSTSPRIATAATERTVQAALTPRTARTVADRAWRTHVLLRGDDRWLVGVCAACARAWGVPRAMVRAQILLLTPLGLGVPLYLLGALLLPRQRADGNIVGGPIPWIDLPRIARYLFLLVAAVPLVLVLYVWLSFLGYWIPNALAVCLALAMGGGVLLWLAARAAARDRREAMFALLAHRAQLLDEPALSAFLAERRTSLELSGLFTAGRGPEHDGPHAAGHERAAHRPFRSRQPRRPAASARTILAVLAAMVAVTALTVLLLNVQPTLLPPGLDAPVLPQAGPVTVGTALAAALGGTMLIILGARGRRSGILLLAALLAAGGALSGGALLRIAHDPSAEPFVLTTADLERDGYHSCPSGLGELDRPVLIDLSDLDAQRAEQLRALSSAQRPDDVPEPVIIDCYRPIGQITVRLPEDPGLVAVTLHGSRSPEVQRQPEDPVVRVWGSVDVGAVDLEEPAAKQDAAEQDDTEHGVSEQDQEDA